MGWEKAEFTGLEKLVKDLETAKDLVIKEDIKKLEQLKEIFEAQTKAVKESEKVDGLG